MTDRGVRWQLFGVETERFDRLFGAVRTDSAQTALDRLRADDAIWTERGVECLGTHREYPSRSRMKVHRDFHVWVKPPVISKRGKAIWERRQAGESIEAIADDYRLPPERIKQILRRHERIVQALQK